MEVPPAPSTYVKAPLAPLGSFIPLSNPILFGLAPTFGVVPASWRKLHVPDATALLDFQSVSFFFRCGLQGWQRQRHGGLCGGPAWRRGGALTVGGALADGGALGGLAAGTLGACPR
jgi:hypothetical protein